MALTKPDKARGETSHAWPEILPDGRAVLFTVRSGDGFQIGALNLDSGEQKIILPAGTSPRFLRPGYLVFGVEDTLRAVRFDPVALKVIGEPVRVLQDVLSKTSGGVDFNVGADGTLAYVAGSAALYQRRLVWVDRKGDVQPIAVPSRVYGGVRLAPDGTRLVLDVQDQQPGLWVWDMTRETLTAVVRSEVHRNDNPVWTPDSKRIVFRSEQSGAGNIYSRAADGSGAIEKLSDGPNLQSPGSFSRDGSLLIFSELVTGRGLDLRMLVLGEKPQAMTLLDGKYNERNGELSPDGRLLAYQSDESGRYEVYVAPFPDVKSRRLQVSSGGGVQPAWAGNELFYVTPDRRIMSVAVTSEPVLNAGTRQVVLNAADDFGFGLFSRTYDVSPDGKRFLFSQTRGAGNQSVVVLNWIEELKRLVPGDRD